MLQRQLKMRPPIRKFHDFNYQIYIIYIYPNEGLEMANIILITQDKNRTKT